MHCQPHTCTHATRCGFLCICYTPSAACIASELLPSAQMNFYPCSTLCQLSNKHRFQCVWSCTSNMDFTSQRYPWQGLGKAHASSRPTASKPCSRLRPSSRSCRDLAAFAASAAPTTSTTCQGKAKITKFLQGGAAERSGARRQYPGASMPSNTRERPCQGQGVGSAWSLGPNGSASPTVPPTTHHHHTPTPTHPPTTRTHTPHTPRTRPPSPRPRRSLPASRRPAAPRPPPRHPGRRARWRHRRPAPPPGAVTAPLPPGHACTGRGRGRALLTGANA